MRILFEVIGGIGCALFGLWIGFAIGVLSVDESSVEAET